MAFFEMIERAKSAVLIPREQQVDPEDPLSPEQREEVESSLRRYWKDYDRAMARLESIGQSADDTDRQG
jgi:hypothetical protein